MSRLLLNGLAAVACLHAAGVSLGNISLLGKLAGAHDRARTQRMTIPPKSFVTEDDGDLKIDWSQFIKDD